ncbi:putative metallophosphoesterase At3g03305 [Cynara cardunculus var. scolymus]|uniref:putative metallophosphoesterase At3g03305 n=1 Tax=Cynara cardunculus var. scolymus TaxID=59895 RepID=UPI000D62B6CF|nr:putative metallophosphoesterase At3g03305 [Cynara cardunculus var. scolymus]XP_024968921.1 putative metallophosphoesterase At3g03305 [Cynara cardunculus var. scolymus]
MRINTTMLLILLFLCHNYSSSGKNREILEIKGDNDVVWIVQLSDLHFSVHHPERASDFQKFVGSTLSLINPSLVLITGDLTDGKSKDLLTMKQNEEEWVEYQKTMEDVIKRSGLNKSIFYDLRGNHDNFGVPAIYGAFDYFSNYSITGQLERSQSVNSVTLQTSKRNLLFVSFDSTMSTGLRGPTNLFGHPTDQLLTELNSHLSQWDSTFVKPLTKIAFGHFPLSFSAPSHSKRTLKDIFLKHSITAYLCGHLHTRFGKNLKRHHEMDHNLVNSHHLFQLNIHQRTSSSSTNCPSGGPTVDEFWEWEMGDWRKSRAMRIMAIDRGRVSFIDTDLKIGAKEILILPTYPLDSRYMSTTELNKYKCQSMDDASHIRSLVFSSTPIVSVKAKIYDSSRGDLYMVLETPMSKHGNLYTAPWNSKAFMDLSPDRYWLEIEAIDINDRLSSTEPRPFSLNGLRADLSWTWKEFFVMGCQWAALYYPIFWSFYFLAFIVLLLPKAIISRWKNQCSYGFFKANKGFLNGLIWVFAEVYSVPFLWKMMLAYLFYLLLCPWLLGQVFIGDDDRGYMTYKGWVVDFNDLGKLEFLGWPDIMVVVIPHLYFVVLPAIFIIGAVAAERAMYRDHVCSLSEKKRDDNSVKNGRFTSINHGNGRVLEKLRRWARSILFVFSLAVCWKHFKNCRALMKAYEMNPLVHFPFYSFTIPLLLAYVFYKTKRPEA